MAQIADFYPETNNGAASGSEEPSVDQALNISRTPGEALRIQREKLGLTLEQVHAALKIRTEYLQALEDQHFKIIPSQGYVKAWLRKYAQYLQLDADQVVARFEKENAVFEEAPVEAVDMGKRSIGARGKVSALALGLMIVGAGWFAAPAMLRQIAPQKKAGPVTVLEEGNPSVTGAAASIVSSEKALVLRARQSAWLEARGPDGTIFLSRELAPGETYEPAAGPGWTVFAHDGGAFEVYYGGGFIGLLGEPGAEVQAYRLEEAVNTAKADAAAAKAAQDASAVSAAQAAQARTAAANAAAVAPRPAAAAPPATVVVAPVEPVAPVAEPSIAAPPAQ